MKVICYTMAAVGVAAFSGIDRRGGWGDYAAPYAAPYTAPYAAPYTAPYAAPYTDSGTAYIPAAGDWTEYTGPYSTYWTSEYGTAYADSWTAYGAAYAELYGDKSVEAYLDYAGDIAAEYGEDYVASKLSLANTLAEKYGFEAGQAYADYGFDVASTYYPSDVTDYGANIVSKYTIAAAEVADQWSSKSTDKYLGYAKTIAGKYAWDGVIPATPEIPAIPDFVPTLTAKVLAYGWDESDGLYYFKTAAKFLKKNNDLTAFSAFVDEQVEIASMSAKKIVKAAGRL